MFILLGALCESNVTQLSKDCSPSGKHLTNEKMSPFCPQILPCQSWGEPSPWPVRRCKPLMLSVFSSQFPSLLTSTAGRLILSNDIFFKNLLLRYIFWLWILWHQIFIYARNFKSPFWNTKSQNKKFNHLFLHPYRSRYSDLF